MKVIELTRGQAAIVDDEDFFELAQYRWRFDGRYAYRHIYPAGLKGKCVRIDMHVAIARTPKGFLTDHRNGNTLDNRRRNLRTATHSQSNMNRRGKRDSQTGRKGVFFTPKSSRSKPYRARIGANGKQYNLGSFVTAAEAQEAYARAAVEMHGEFARLN